MCQNCCVYWIRFHFIGLHLTSGVWTGTCKKIFKKGKQTSVLRKVHSSCHVCYRDGNTVHFNPLTYFNNSEQVNSCQDLNISIMIITWIHLQTTKIPSDQQGKHAEQVHCEQLGVGHRSCFRLTKSTNNCDRKDTQCSSVPTLQHLGERYMIQALATRRTLENSHINSFSV